MDCHGFEEGFYGSVTIGERGQIVIPADARQALGWLPGEKLLIMRHPIYKGIMAFKLESVREFLDEFSKGVDRVEQEANMEEPE